MNIGIFGTSSNPPHFGHLKAIQLSLEILDEVLIIPSNNHQFKNYDVPTKARLDMAQLAFNNIENAKVDDIAIRLNLSGKHWDLINELEKIHNAQFHIIVGSDVINDILNDKWYRGKYLLNKYPFIVFERNNCPNLDPPHKIIKFNSNVSSTMLRSNLELLKHHCCPSVVNYIQRNNLYAY